ncbi:MAG: hypothetical protein B7Z37_10800 [Verrucomicrobia bacterium 12-59-8]|nr:MAG: hypothetical protein B7Z37_10800 [Verrucomicrobia bacterium 12-59-8]
MFKILKSLSKSLGGAHKPAAEAKSTAKEGSLLDKVNKGAPASAKLEPTTRRTRCSMPSCRCVRSTLARFEADTVCRFQQGLHLVMSHAANSSLPQ